MESTNAMAKPVGCKIFWNTVNKDHDIISNWRHIILPVKVCKGRLYNLYQSNFK